MTGRDLYRWRVRMAAALGLPGELNQEEAAAVAATTQPTWSRWEASKRVRPMVARHLEAIERLAAYEPATVAKWAGMEVAGRCD